ncbi:ras GEF [Clavulina sp. PMI_390]|nr:ras GEF [Clavulina sp. PMI_390]
MIPPPPRSSTSQIFSPPHGFRSTRMSVRAQPTTTSRPAPPLASVSLTSRPSSSSTHHPHPTTSSTPQHIGDYNPAILDSLSTDLDELHIGGNGEHTPPPSYRLLAEDDEHTVDVEEHEAAAASQLEVVAPAPQSTQPIPLRAPPSNRPSTASSDSHLRQNPNASTPSFAPGSYSSSTQSIPVSFQSTQPYNPRSSIASESVPYPPSPVSYVSPSQPHPQYMARAPSLTIQTNNLTPAPVASRHNTYLAPNYAGGGETLQELVWRVLWSQEPRDVQVLLAIHPSFTTSFELLRELRDNFLTADPTNGQGRWLRSRIIDILHQWVFSDDFDSSLGSELQGFLASQVRTDVSLRANVPISEMFRKLEFSVYASDSTLSLSHDSASSTLVKPPPRKNARPLRAESVAKMKDKDLTELAGALEIMELEMRAQLTVSKVVKWLKWRRSPAGQGPTARPFSTLSDKIAAWVVDACLQGSLDHRAQTLAKFVLVAEKCKEAGNLASLSDLLYGLRSPAIDKLEQTRRFAGNIDAKLYELMQLVQPRTPHRLFPLNPRMLAFISPFNNTILESGLISWARCRELHTALFAAVAPPANYQVPAIHPSYSSFLSVQIHTGLQNARNHTALSQKVADDEVREKSLRERSAAGMRTR